MNELLAHPAVQTALVVVIVTGLQALVVWLKQKFPTQAASVEANWCYLQPAVEAAIAAVQAASVRSSFGSAAVANIITKAVTEFTDSYRILEGKEASVKEVEAARAEIAEAVARVI